MKNLIGLIIILTFGLFLNSCQSQEKETLVKISTEYGDMTVKLYDQTPQHKENFLKLVKDGYYDSLLFHRVIQGFMIQGGDPDSKNAPANKMLGNGGPGYTIPAEFNDSLFHKKGALAAARTGDQQNPQKASSGSQFYIVQGQVFTNEQLTTNVQMLNQYLGQLLQKEEYKPLGDSLNALYMAGKSEELNNMIMSLRPVVEKEFNVDLSITISKEKMDAYTTIGGTPFLDNQYTVFGEVIEGLDVIDKIAAVQTGQGDRPVKDVRMTMKIVK